jgi:hypothetical protein
MGSKRNVLWVVSETFSWVVSDTLFVLFSCDLFRFASLKLSRKKKGMFVVVKEKVGKVNEDFRMKNVVEID